MSSESGLPNWIVTTGPGASLKTVEQEFKRIGFTIVQVFEALNALEVRGTEAQVKKAKELPEVADISKSEVVDIGPPDLQDT
jgi:hypothetical protein